MEPEKGLIEYTGAISPADVVSNATEQAKLLMNIVEQTKCFQEISGKKYLQVEAWETIGAFNRVHAVTREVSPIDDRGDVEGYLATVELLNSDGMVVGGATMPCFFTENACKGKEGDAKHKACMSAAQTFATSKAYRMNYSYVAILAGYQPTPADEMTGSDPIGQVPSESHWCKIHKTKFFKKGKMKGYAHPIEGTDEWCNEADEVIMDALSPDPPTESPPKTEDRGYDVKWYGETYKALGKKNTDVLIELAKDYNVTGKTPSEAINNLNRMQEAELHTKLEELLELI